MEPEKRQSLEHDIARLEVASREAAQSRRRAAQTARLVTAALCATLLIFFTINFVHFRSQWSNNALLAKFEQEMRSFGPLALREVQALGKSLLPVYAAAGRAQAGQLMPEVNVRLKEELDVLCTDVLANTHGNLGASEKRVLGRIEEQLFLSYPELHDAKRREKLKESFRAITEQAVLQSIQEFQETFSKDVDAVKETILKFEVTDTDEDTVDLQKKFLRLWLQLLDEEIEQI